MSQKQRLISRFPQSSARRYHCVTLLDLYSTIPYILYEQQFFSFRVSGSAEVPRIKRIRLTTRKILCSLFLSGRKTFKGFTSLPGTCNNFLTVRQPVRFLCSLGGDILRKFSSNSTDCRQIRSRFRQDRDKCNRCTLAHREQLLAILVISLFLFRLIRFFLF